MDIGNSKNYLGIYFSPTNELFIIKINSVQGDLTNILASIKKKHCLRKLFAAASVLRLNE